MVHFSVSTPPKVVQPDRRPPSPYVITYEDIKLKNWTGRPTSGCTNRYVRLERGVGTRREGKREQQREGWNLKNQHVVHKTLQWKIEIIRENSRTYEKYADVNLYTKLINTGNFIIDCKLDVKRRISAKMVQRKNLNYKGDKNRIALAIYMKAL